MLPADVACQACDPQQQGRKSWPCRDMICARHWDCRAELLRQDQRLLRLAHAGDVVVRDIELRATRLLGAPIVGEPTACVAFDPISRVCFGVESANICLLPAGKRDTDIPTGFGLQFDRLEYYLTLHLGHNHIKQQRRLPGYQQESFPPSRVARRAYRSSRPMGERPCKLRATPMRWRARQSNHLTKMVGHLVGSARTVFKLSKPARLKQPSAFRARVCCAAVSAIAPPRTAASRRSAPA